MESSAIQGGTQRGELEPDKTTSEAVSSDDTISSINQQANAMQVAEPIHAPPTVRRLAPSLDSCASHDEIQQGEKEHDQTFSKSLLSEDTNSFTHQQADAMQQSDPILVYTHIPGSGRITTLMTNSQMQQLKPHRKTKITGKWAYLCGHCRGLGHTKPTCPRVLSGN